MRSVSGAGVLLERHRDKGEGGESLSPTLLGDSPLGEFRRRTGEKLASVRLAARLCLLAHAMSSTGVAGRGNRAGVAVRPPITQLIFMNRLLRSTERAR